MISWPSANSIGADAVFVLGKLRQHALKCGRLRYVSLSDLSHRPVLMNPLLY